MKKNTFTIEVKSFWKKKLLRLEIWIFFNNRLNPQSYARGVVVEAESFQKAPPASSPSLPGNLRNRALPDPPPKSKSEAHQRRNGETIGTLDPSRLRSRTLDPPCTSPEPATRPATAEAAADVAAEAEAEEEAAAAEITTITAETRSRSRTTTSTTSTSSRHRSNNRSSTRIGTHRISISSGCGEIRAPPPPRGLEMLRWGRRRSSTL